MSITTDFSALRGLGFAKLRRHRQRGVALGSHLLACSAMLALLALGPFGCASRYQMGATTALAVDAMATAAEQRRNGDIPVGPYAAVAGKRLATEGDADEGRDADD